MEAADRPNRPVTPWLDDGALEQAVLEAAEDWWLAKRPARYSEEDHYHNPTINCRTPAERALAERVAAQVKAIP